MGSFGTPIGLHAIAEKIGANEPAGTAFKSRLPEKHYSDYTPDEQKQNLITSRIVRLRGLEAGINSGNEVDSYQRCIYIHGTNHEELIGQPFSKGCIEMLNADIIHLFSRIEQEDLVWICLN